MMVDRSQAGLAGLADRLPGAAAVGVGHARRTRLAGPSSARRASAAAARAALCLLLAAMGSAALGQSRAELERLGRGYIDAKRKYDAAIAASRYSEAVTHGRKMVAAIEKLWPERKDLVGTQCHWLAIACSRAGVYDEAEANFRRALELRQEAHGADHPLVAETLNSAAVFYRKLARYPEAEAAAARSLAIRERHFGGQHNTVAVSANNLAAVYFDLGRFADSEALLGRALAIHERNLGPNHRSVADNVANLASIYRTSGQLELAVEYDERALAIRRAEYGPRHAETALSLNNLGLSYAAVGRYHEAVRLEEEALALRTELLGSAHPDTLTTMNNLAVAYGEQRRLGEALELQLRVYETKRKVLGDDHPTIAIALANLATLYAELGRREEARSTREQSQARMLAIYGADHPNYAFGLMNSGRQFALAGRSDEAIGELARALEIFKSAFGSDHPDVAACAQFLAESYFAAGRYDEAADLLDHVIAIRDAAGVAPGLQSRGYLWRAEVRERLGQRDRAEDDLRQAMLRAEQQRAGVAGGAEARAKAFAMYRRAYERMVALQAAKGDVGEAFHAAERGRARSLGDQMAAAHVDLLAGLPPDEARRLHQRERLARLRAAQIEYELGQMPPPARATDEERAQRESLVGQLAEVRREAVAAYMAIRDASPAHRQAVGRDGLPPRLEAVQSALVGDRGLLLEYALGTDESFVIVVPGGGREASIHRLTVAPKQAEILGIAAGNLTGPSLGRALANEEQSGVVQWLGDPQQALAATEELAALWEIVIPQEVRGELLEGKLDRLLLIPDGALGLLPFESLVVVDGEQPQYLLDVGPPVVYGPSAAVLMNLASDRPAAVSDRKPVLTVGDPAYGEAAVGGAGAGSRYALHGGSLAPLPFSGRESRWVGEVFRQAGIEAGQLSGGDASEAQVRFNAAGRRILHFACHGLADEQWGNFFGSLALARGPARPAPPADDGFLTLAEIYELDLKGCELAILSACNTNYGPDLVGEGAWALSRGFLVAGARRVVASNWLVDDEAAASLVSYFASGVAKGMQADQPSGYDQALQAAKRWTRRQRKWQSPYYWATFVMLGPG